MGEMIPPITLLKLGGSLITNKDRPLSVNHVALGRIAKSIGRSELPSEKRSLIIVHGGGSFGHYYAKKFGLSETPRKIAPYAISRIEQSMMELHSCVLNALVNSGKSCSTVLARELIAHPPMLSSAGLTKLKKMLILGLVPVTFGNVAYSLKNSQIISGDAICESIVRSMPVDRLVFVMDVDGIYPTSKITGHILQSVTREDGIGTKTRRFDVTGGIASKIRLGLRVARDGTEVFYVNGNKPDRLSKLLASGIVSRVKATIISPANGRR